MKIDRTKKTFLVAFTHFEYATMWGDEKKYCGYDTSNQWEDYAWEYLDEGGQVVLLETDQQIERTETVETHLFGILNGVDPEDLGYSIDQIFDRESYLNGK